MPVWEGSGSSTLKKILTSTSCGGRPHSILLQKRGLHLISTWLPQGGVGRATVEMSFSSWTKEAYQLPKQSLWHLRPFYREDLVEFSSAIQRSLWLGVLESDNDEDDSPLSAAFPLFSTRPAIPNPSHHLIISVL